MCVYIYVSYFRGKDYYHTCYALSGLSVAQHFASGQIGKVKVVGTEDNEVVCK